MWSTTRATLVEIGYGLCMSNEGPVTVPIAPDDLMPDLDDSQRLALARLFEDVPADRQERQRTIRVMCHALARHICALCPAGAHRDDAVQHLVAASRAAQAALIV